MHYLKIWLIYLMKNSFLFIIIDLMVSLIWVIHFVFISAQCIHTYQTVQILALERVDKPH